MRFYALEGLLSAYKLSILEVGIRNGAGVSFNMKSVNCDALVIGGGVAGVSAAIAAARLGAKTILVEKDSFLGGTAYAGLFQYICGLYLNGDPFPSDTLNEGLTREISSALLRAFPGRSIRKIGQVYMLPYSPDYLQKLLSDLCDAESALTVIRNSVASSVKKNEAEISSVLIDHPSGEMEIGASVAIDCTGDGDFSHLAGAESELAPPAKRQLAGYMVYMKGLKPCNEILSIKVPWALTTAVKQGYLPQILRLTTFIPGNSPEEGFCKISIDGESSFESDSMAEIYAQEMLDFLAESIPAFRNAFIAGKSIRTLNREGRRVCGEYTLTEEDIMAARKFPDGVVKNSWPIEFWDRSKGPVYKYLRRGEYYEIPFRCLKAKNIKNLLMAGRCISATQLALGSTRVIGTCMALGEKAGIAASHYIKRGKYPEGKF